MKFYCECFDEHDSIPGFDVDAEALGAISVKIDENGDLMDINEGGYDNLQIGKIDYLNARCGCCGERATLKKD